jgi:hypothetical protein
MLEVFKVVPAKRGEIHLLLTKSKFLEVAATSLKRR